MDPILGGAAIGAAGNLLSGALAGQASAKSADKQMRWQEVMSNTAYRRQVWDMREAGLNPILAVSKGMGGGASVPPGAGYSYPDTRLGDAITQGASAAAARSLQKQQEAIGRQVERKERGMADSAEWRAKVDEVEGRIADAFVHNHPQNGIQVESQRRIEEARAASTAASIERELDEAAGEATRALRRLGISGGSAAQILNLMRERGSRIPRR